ncbi:unnamed protein product [Caenorhabditis bovis]|uniref:G-protein coupled receptors family 1 profile domain-containing protein n=1 Tax=Caenorhabditis bovis TaxID=2654633 RepID=A0A8S1EY29_9PELO|nr:unnamed protein product [Caenorhabditis bovis]
MAPTCASDEQMTLQTSFLLRSNIVLMTFIAICTFFLSYKALIVLKSYQIFHPSTKLLLITSLVFVNFHEIVFMFVQVVTFYRSITLSNEPCKIMRSTYECKYQNQMIIVGIAGMIYVQSALSLDRLIATIFPLHYSKTKYSPGIVLSILVVISSILSPIIIVWNDPYVDTVPNCFFFPQYSASRANTFLIICNVVIIVCIFLNILLIVINKKLEVRTRFFVEKRYQKRETLVSTRVVCYIAVAQFLGLITYSSLVLTLRLHQKFIPVSMYHNIVWWAYTVPFAAVSLPALLIYRIKRIGIVRRKTINQITTRFETQEEHMKHLKELWS